MYYYQDMKTMPRFKEVIYNTFANIPRKRVNCIAALMAGLMFFIGWWLLIDASVVHQVFMNDNRIYHIPGVIGSLAMVLVNIIPNHVVHREYGHWSVTAIMFLFLGLVMAFGSLIGATYILVHDFIINQSENFYAGFAVFMQNLLIFAADMTAKFGTRRLPTF